MFDNIIFRYIKIFVHSIKEIDIFNSLPGKKTTLDFEEQISSFERNLNILTFSLSLYSEKIQFINLISFEPFLPFRINPVLLIRQKNKSFRIRISFYQLLISIIQTILLEVIYSLPNIINTSPSSLTL